MGLFVGKPKRNSPTGTKLRQDMLVEIVAEPKRNSPTGTKLRQG
jgi:hypothetical protein